MKLSLKNGLLFGLLVGIGSALFYAPRPGKELRAELSQKAGTIPQQCLNLLESLVDLVVSILDFAVVAFQEQGDKLSRAMSNGICVAKEKSDELKGFVNKVSVSQK